MFPAWYAKMGCVSVLFAVYGVVRPKTNQGPKARKRRGWENPLWMSKRCPDQLREYDWSRAGSGWLLRIELLLARSALCARPPPFFDLASISAQAQSQQRRAPTSVHHGGYRRPTTGSGRVWWVVGVGAFPVHLHCVTGARSSFSLGNGILMCRSFLAACCRHPPKPYVVALMEPRKVHLFLFSWSTLLWQTRYCAVWSIVVASPVTTQSPESRRCSGGRGKSASAAAAKRNARKARNSVREVLPYGKACYTRQSAWDPPITMS